MAGVLSRSDTARQALESRRRGFVLVQHMPDADEATDPGRRWYHLRPEPRRRTDLMGINSSFWMVLAWALVILLIVSPWPWW